MQICFDIFKKRIDDNLKNKYLDLDKIRELLVFLHAALMMSKKHLLLYDGAVAVKI